MPAARAIISAKLALGCEKDDCQQHARHKEGSRGARCATPGDDIARDAQPGEPGT
jgi:hypothetical protein